MRTLACAALALLTLGCNNLRTCKKGTVLLTVDVPSGTDQVEIVVSVDGTAMDAQTVQLPPGKTHGTIELDFSSYPAGHSVSVEVTAIAGDTAVGTVDSDAKSLAATCDTFSLSVGGGDNGDLGVDDEDLAGADLTGAPPGDMAGGPSLLANGQTCSDGTMCQSGNCVDSVCCNMPQAMCTGCYACNVPTSPGLCAPVPMNMDPHGTCPMNASTCTAGGCDGNGNCTPSASSVVCKSQCNASMIATAKCSGTATGCPALGTPTACPGGTSCADTMNCSGGCNTDGDCASGFWCDKPFCQPQAALKGACTTNGTTCTSTSCDQCTGNAPCTTFYADADGDSYGSTTNSSTFCGTIAPTGYTTDHSDCCDVINSPSAQATHPGQTGWFNSANSCGSYDYNCDNNPEHEFTGTGTCTTKGSCGCQTSGGTPYSCLFSAGWVGSDPGCGNNGSWLTQCGVFPACSCTCADTNNRCGGSCNSSQNQSASKQQYCR